MSHGGLNILGKKSWNVWNRDNRDRVAKDEAKLAEEENNKRRRAEGAEQEARLSHLRERAHRPEHEEAFSAPVDGALFDGKTGHINLFADADVKTGALNPEAEAEKKAKKDADERKLGIVKYLDEGAHKKAWYEKRGEGAQADEEDEQGRSKTGGEKARFPLTAEARKRIDDAHKSKSDPVAHMAALLHQTRPAPVTKGATKAPTKPAYDSVAALRAERDARERAERLKAERIVHASSAAGSGAGGAAIEAKRGYNSGYMRR